MERMNESHFKRVDKFWERRFKRYRFSRLALTDLSSAFRICFPWNLHRPVSVPPGTDFHISSPTGRNPAGKGSGVQWTSGRHLRWRSGTWDKGSINQVITLNIVSEEPDEDRNTQQQVIIQQKMTSRGHWNSDGVKSLTSRDSKWRTDRKKRRKSGSYHSWQLTWMNLCPSPLRVFVIIWQVELSMFHIGSCYGARLTWSINETICDRENVTFVTTTHPHIFCSDGVCVLCTISWQGDCDLPATYRCK